MKRLELGVFIPVGNNGWIVSRTAPQYKPTFDLNRRICQLAEQIGFDFVFSMSKWRGYGGETEFWDHTLESITLMAAMAAVTSRVRIYASLQPLMVPPPVAAKMASTIDEISGGRSGINIVTGAYLGETAQMGLLPDGYDSNRYEYAAEWVELVKRLWNEDSVTHHGKYFNLTDCRSTPKPISKPYPDIVCAGISEAGMRFAARHGTHSFLAGRTTDEVAVQSRTVKDMAKEAGRNVKTQALVILLQGDTDEQARDLSDYYTSGADTAALINIAAMITGASGDMVKDIAKKFVFFGCTPLVGGAETIASVLNGWVHDGALDGVMFCFPDFIEGMTLFNRTVMPILEEKYHLR